MKWKPSVQNYLIELKSRSPHFDYEYPNKVIGFISSAFRARIIDWVRELASELGLTKCTVFLAISYFDSFLG